jgi:uncharacterized alkaline shock family protein YloU
VVAGGQDRLQPPQFLPGFHDGESPWDAESINNFKRNLMTGETNPMGSINVSPRAIATIAFHAARESYGVVGLAHKNLVNGLAQALVKDPTHGVEVRYDGTQINIDVYVIIEYGTRITSVATSVSNTVRYHVEKALGLPVHQVNIHVRGLRVSTFD